MIEQSTMEDNDQIVWNVEHIYNPSSTSVFAIVILNESLHSHDSSYITSIKSLWNKATVRVCVDGGTNEYHEILKNNCKTAAPSNKGISASTNKGTAAPSNKGTSTPSNKGTSAPSNKGISASTNKGTAAAPSNKGTSTPSNKGTSTPSNKGTSAPLKKDTADIEADSDVLLPSIITGDFDSIDVKLLKLYDCLKVKIIHTPNQDETDFTKAICVLNNYCQEQNIQLERILTIGGINCDRFDHVMAHINTLHKTMLTVSCPTIIMSGPSLLWMLPPKSHRIIVPTEVRNSGKRSWCGYIPFCQPTTVTTTGFKWNLDNETVEFGKRVSTSNTYGPGSDKGITINCSHPLLWTMGWCQDTILSTPQSLQYQSYEDSLQSPSSIPDLQLVVSNHNLSSNSDAPIIDTSNSLSSASHAIVVNGISSDSDHLSEVKFS